MRSKRSLARLLPGLLAALLLVGGLPGAAEAKSRHHRHGHHEHLASQGGWRVAWYGYGGPHRAAYLVHGHRGYDAPAYVCRHCHHGFVSLHALYDHAHVHHGVAVVALPSLVIQTSFGWVFGH